MTRLPDELNTASGRVPGADSAASGRESRSVPAHNGVAMVAMAPVLAMAG